MQKRQSNIDYIYPMHVFFNSDPIWQQKGIALIRILVGLLMIYHGKEVFDAATMKIYTEWNIFNNSFGTFLVYMGKSSELFAGMLLTFGFLTRIGSVLLTGTLLYITFFVGHGKFWYEDQHPFMFVLFGILFFFTGPGALSLDSIIFNKRH